MDAKRVDEEHIHTRGGGGGDERWGWWEEKAEMGK
jgi:hypothetical protein